MDATWTLPALVAEVAAQIAALPPPRNGQVRAVPDERTVRYYVTLGLLDRPSAMRGRTALYGARHLAQVVAIKRLQTMGRSLSEILQLWPTLDDRTLARMSGVALPVESQPPARAEFWKRDPVHRDAAKAAGGEAPGLFAPPGVAPFGPPGVPPGVPPGPPPGAVELRIELAPGVVLSLSVTDESVAISPADVHALRAAAAPLVTELASRRLASHAQGEEP